MEMAACCIQVVVGLPAHLGTVNGKSMWEKKRRQVWNSTTVSTPGPHQFMNWV